MAIPVTIPYSFANATTTQNLAYLDANYNALVNGLNGLANGASQISISSISATGNANATTYLRGDGSWSTISGGGSGTVTSVNANSTVSGFTFTGGPITASGILTLTGPSPGTSGNVLTSNGSSWISSSGSYPLTSGTAVASTSGTSIDFTSIPSWVKRITVMFNGVSTNGTSLKLVQIGSGSVTASGYVSAGSAIQGGLGVDSSSSTAGFVIRSAEAADNLNGAMVIMLLTSNNYVANHTFGDVSGTYINSFMGGGTVTLSGVLDRVRITTVNGTDTFDAGSINILYE
jgi:hypothetical protein